MAALALLWACLAGCTTTSPEAGTKVVRGAPVPEPVPERSDVEEIAADDPIAWWRLDELDGEEAADSSGHDRTGAYRGLPALGAAGAPLDERTRGVAFDGADDALVVAADRAFRLGGSSSVELWVSVAAGTSTALLRAGDGSTAGGWRLEANEDGSVAFVRGDGAVATPPGSLAPGPMHHVALTSDGSGSTRLFVDGGLVASAAVAVPPTGLTALPLRLGPDGGARIVVDELAFYDVALPPERVAAHVRRRSSPPVSYAAPFHLAYDAPQPPDATANGIVVLNPWETERRRLLETTNPGLVVLMYKNLGFMRGDVHDPSGLSSSGVRTTEADAGHPEWFALDPAGERLTSRSYPELFAADVGDPGYQERWAGNVLTELEAGGWDGVFVDDVNTTMRFHAPVDQVAAYPTDPAYQAAVASALETVSRRIRGPGHLVVANIGSPHLHPERWGEWLAHLDGAMDEHFVKHGDGDPSLDGYVWAWGEVGDWTTHLGFVDEAERQGRSFLGMTHSRVDDDRAARYGLATVLLASEGRASFAHVDSTAGGAPAVLADRALAARLGAPTGPAVRLPDGAHRRDFEGGVVLVNPQRDATVTVDLGTEHVGAGGAATRIARVEGRSAAILVRT